MLVLADPDRLGVDLDQLGQGVHQPPADGDAPPDGNILVGKLLPGRLGGRVNGSAALVDHDHLDVPGQIEAADERFGLSAGRPVADGDGFDSKTIAPLSDPGSGLFGAFLGQQKNGIVMDQFPLGVEADHLAPGPKTRIDGQDPFSAKRRGQKELAEVFGKDPDGFLVGLFFRLQANLGLHRRRKEPFVAVLHGQLNLPGGRPFPLDEKMFQDPQRPLFGRNGPEDKETLLFPPAQGQDPVGGRAGHGLFPVEIIPVFDPFLFPTRDDFRPKHRLRGEIITHPGPGGFILADPFGDDVAGPGQGLFRRGHSLFGIDVGQSLGVEVQLSLIKKAAGQRLQSFFPGDGGPGPAFGPEGQINILQDGQGLGGLDFLLQGLRELPSFFHGLENGIPALVQLQELTHPVPDHGNSHLIQGPGGFLPVAGDKGDRGPAVQEVGRGLYLSGGQTQFLGNHCQMSFIHDSNHLFLWMSGVNRSGRLEKTRSFG